MSVNAFDKEPYFGVLFFLQPSWFAFDEELIGVAIADAIKNL
jgi:hypothetical protein